MVKKVKRKISVDIRLFLIRNVFKTLKYYFKSIWYILFTNVVLISIFYKLIKLPYSLFLSRHIKSYTLYNILCYGIFIVFLYVIKIILYGNAVYMIKRGSGNDIKELFSNVVKRFMPTLGTFMLYLCAVLLFSLLLILPGVLFFFYYFFAVFLCAIGDLNNKKESNPEIMSGVKALSRSYVLVKGNLIRFAILSCVMIFITYFMYVFAINSIKILDFRLNSLMLNIILNSVYDMLVIYGIVMFIKLEGIENDVMEEEINASMEEQALLNTAAVNNFGKSKK